MIASSEVALRQALRAALLASTDITNALGGAKIYDEAPREAQPPYITFGDSKVRDWSTTTDTGAEHIVVLNVWSTQRGLLEALQIAGAMTALLDDAPLALTGFRLVNLRFCGQDDAQYRRAWSGSIKSLLADNGRSARFSERKRGSFQPITMRRPLAGRHRTTP